MNFACSTDRYAIDSMLNILLTKKKQRQNLEQQVIFFREKKIHSSADVDNNIVERIIPFSFEREKKEI